MPTGKYTTADIAGRYSPADIASVQSAQPGIDDLSNVPGSLPGMQTPGQAAGIQTPKLHGTSIDYGKVLTAGDVLKGAAKGALHTGYGVQRIATLGLAPQLPGQQEFEQRLAPTNTAQRIGYGGEQAGEFLIPGGAEEKGAVKLAELAPALGKYATPLARTLTRAASSGLINKAQGGDFTTGAAAGGAGGLASEGLRVVAPTIAESAIGIRAPDRAAGRKAGQMILDETKGFNAGSIARQGQAKLTGWTNELERATANSPLPIDLMPARTLSSDAEAEAAFRNEPDTMKRTGQLSNLLNTEYGTNTAIPPQVSATRGLALKRGTGALKGSWNPATPNDFADAAVGRVYGSLDQALNQAVPGSERLNQQISSMIPVAQRAGATDLNASSLQRILGRFTRPTGALLTGAAGAKYGYGSEHDIPRALLYGAAGVAAPELIGSPTAQMGMARLASKGATPVVRTLLGGGLQANRKSLYDPQ